MPPNKTVRRWKRLRGRLCRVQVPVLAPLSHEREDSPEIPLPHAAFVPMSMAELDIVRANLDTLVAYTEALLGATAAVLAYVPVVPQQGVKAVEPALRMLRHKNADLSVSGERGKGSGEVAVPPAASLPSNVGIKREHSPDGYVAHLATVTEEDVDRLVEVSEANGQEIAAVAEWDQAGIPSSPVEGFQSEPPSPVFEEMEAEAGVDQIMGEAAPSSSFFRRVVTVKNDCVPKVIIIRKILEACPAHRGTKDCCIQSQEKCEDCPDARILCTCLEPASVLLLCEALGEGGEPRFLAGGVLEGLGMLPRLHLVTLTNVGLFTWEMRTLLIYGFKKIQFRTVKVFGSTRRGCWMFWEDLEFGLGQRFDLAFKDLVYKCMPGDPESAACLVREVLPSHFVEMEGDGFEVEPVVKP